METNGDCGISTTITIKDVAILLIIGSAAESFSSTLVSILNDDDSTIWAQKILTKWHSPKFRYEKTNLAVLLRLLIE